VKLTNHLTKIPHDGPIAIFVGAMARGSDDFADGIVDEKISISNYPLSASVACGKVSLTFPPGELVRFTDLQFCCALEDLWDIV
jgi:rRNA small subunit pseudouridine methyltransferase Nep1